MDSFLTQASVLLREIQHDLVSYENASNREADLISSKVLTDKFQQLLEICDRLDILTHKEPVQRRAQSRQRVNEIKYDIRHYQTAFDNIGLKKQQRDEAERARHAILHRKFTPSTTNVNGETQLQLDGALDFSERLDSAHSHIDNSLEQGRLTLLSLQSQGELIKSIRTKMISMGNLLGLSSTVIHSIERRTASDWWLLFGGMIVTLIIMFVLYKWLV